MGRRIDLTWTLAPVDELPTPEEIAPPTARPVQRLSTHQAFWRLWFWLGAILTLSVVGALAYPLDQFLRLRADVAAAVHAEEQAVTAGDLAALEELYDQSAGAWTVRQLAAVRQGIAPWPQPLPGAVLEPGAAVVQSVEQIGYCLARAEVRRRYRLPDGREATFALLQFYRYRGEAWQRTAAPEDISGDPQWTAGAHVRIAHSPADAAQARNLVAYLDDVLGRMCAEWGGTCPSDLRLTVEFFVPLDPLTENAYLAAPDRGSLVFRILQAPLGQARVGPMVDVPSPSAVGIPVDAEAEQSFLREAAARALVSAAPQLTATARNLATAAMIDADADVPIQEARPAGDSEAVNAFLYALLVRQAARLGVEAPGLATLTVANPYFTAEELWAVPHVVYETAATLPQALAIVNTLLTGQAPSAETALFTALAAAPDPVTWVADGLALTPAEARARLAAAMDPPFPAVLRPVGAVDLALSGAAGPVLASRDGRQWPLLAGTFPDSRILGWSRDGRRLALSISGRPGVVDLATGTGQWLPGAARPNGTSWMEWASNTMVAYWTARTPDPASDGHAGLAFFDVANPARVISGSALRGVDSYTPSPDPSGMAVLSRSSPYGIALSWYGPGRNQPLWLGLGRAPIWSPDGKQLVYDGQQLAETTFALHVVDVATSEDRVLLDSADPRLPMPPVGTQRIAIQRQWTPDGRRLLFLIAFQGEAGGRGTWLGEIGVDGTGLRIVAASQSGIAPFLAGSSADGRYLAMHVRPGSTGAMVTVVYDASSLTQLRRVPGFALSEPEPWSSAGHTLLLTDGLDLDALARPEAEPTRLAPGAVAARWRPLSPNPEHNP